MVLPLEGWLVPCVQPRAACCPRSLPLLLLPTLLAPKTRMFCLFTASLPHNTPTTRSAPQISFPPRCPGRC